MCGEGVGTPRYFREATPSTESAVRSGARTMSYCCYVQEELSSVLVQDTHCRHWCTNTVFVSITMRWPLAGISDIQFKLWMNVSSTCAPIFGLDRQTDSQKPIAPSRVIDIEVSVHIFWHKSPMTSAPWCHKRDKHWKLKVFLRDLFQNTIAL